MQKNQNQNIGVLFGAGNIALTLGADERKVRRLLKEGRLKGAKKIGGQWAISLRALLNNFPDAPDQSTADHGSA